MGEGTHEAFACAILRILSPVRRKVNAGGRNLMYKDLWEAQRHLKVLRVCLDELRAEARTRPGAWVRDGEMLAECTLVLASWLLEELVADQLPTQDEIQRMFELEL